MAAEKFNNLKVPLFAVAAALVLVLLAWLPANQQPVQQRPYVQLALDYDRGDARLQQMADDLRYRMNTHHGYRLHDPQTPLAPGYQVHQVDVTLRRVQGVDDARLVLRASVADQHIEVDGPLEAAPALSSQLFRLLNSELQSAQQ